jgi:subtilase family serine protease
MQRIFRFWRSAAGVLIALAGSVGMAVGAAGASAGVAQASVPMAGSAVVAQAPVPRAAGSARIVLAGSAPPIAGRERARGAVGGAERQTVEVWLAGRARAAQRFVNAVTTPGSVSYRRFLSPAGYSARFGPRAGQVRAVESFLTGAGFTGVHASVQDDYVAGTAPVSGIERVFAVRLRRYATGSVGGSSTVVSNDRDLSIPASLRSDVLAVTGLDSARPEAADPAAGAVSRPASPAGASSFRASARPADCSRYWGQKSHAFRPAFDGITRAGVGVCGYSADQIRRAYELGSLHSAHTPTGKGQTIALVQGDGAPYEMFRALTDYAKANGLPRPRRGQYRQEAAGGSSTRPCDHASTPEASLDSEAAYAMAPGADQLMVDGNLCRTGEDGDQGLFDAELAPLTRNGSHPQAAIESVSYFIGLEKTVPASVQRIGHAIALRAAAEGVSLLFCSGDDPGVYQQASDPDVTAVGGTTLGIGAHGQRLFETGWSDRYGTRAGTSGPWHDRGISFAGGGGASRLDAQPTYQQGVVPSSLARGRTGQLERTAPDLAADADPQTGMLTGEIDLLPHGKSTRYTMSTSEGTSQATPLIAGMVADAEQVQTKPFGFLNPLRYSLAGSRAFHDILPERAAQPQIDRASYSTRSPLSSAGGNGKVAPYLFVFDDQDRHDTDQVTATGYDTMTGLGSPEGTAFITALRTGQ